MNKNEETENGMAKGLFGETDRENGEYHFRNGDTQELYSNARYVPMDKSVEPPRTYRPVSPEKDSKRNSSTGTIIARCLLCAILGGLTGAFFMGRSAAKTPTATVAQPVAMAESSRAVVLAKPEAEPLVNPEPLTANDIYSLACRQVVAIDTEIVVEDRNGNAYPSAISGSGFAIGDDGLILTNFHVVEESLNRGIPLNVMAWGADVPVSGSVVGYDAERDIALVRAERLSLTPANVGNSDAILVGDAVYTVGNPFGSLEFTLSSGYVSNPDRVVATTENERGIHMFQMDAAIYSGNSGGPVYNDFGQVIGVVSATVSEEDSGEISGIGFAIPINDVIPQIENLMQKNVASDRASLGLVLDDTIDQATWQYYQMPEGAYVASTVSGGCAEAAGIRRGDIITQIGNYPIRGFSDVAGAVREYRPGDSVGVILYRESEFFYVPVVLDEERPDAVNIEVLSQFGRN